MSSTPRVGFLGIGQMGAPMAANIANAGYPLRIFNRTLSKALSLADELAAFDVEVATTPAEAADDADLIVSMLADPVALDRVYLGSDGVFSASKPGFLAIEMSTVGPDAIAHLGARAVAARGALVDAPVSGSIDFARAGTLTIMVGGDAPDVSRAEPLLSILGSNIIRTGGLGTGASMKLVVNTVIYGLNQAVSEALVLAERAGIDRATAYGVFANSAVAAPFVHYRRNAFEHPETAPAAMRIDLAAKDLELILAMGDAVGACLDQATTNLASFRAASVAGYGADDVAAVAEYLRNCPLDE